MNSAMFLLLWWIAPYSSVAVPPATTIPIKSLPGRGVPRHVWTRFCMPLALSVTLESTVVSPEIPEYLVIPANIFRNNDLEVFQKTSVTRIRYLRESPSPTLGRGVGYLFRFQRASEGPGVRSGGSAPGTSPCDRGAGWADEGVRPSMRLDFVGLRSVPCLLCEENLRHRRGPFP